MIVELWLLNLLEIKKKIYRNILNWLFSKLTVVFELTYWKTNYFTMKSVRHALKFGFIFFVFISLIVMTISLSTTAWYMNETVERGLLASSCYYEENEFCGDEYKVC